MKIQKRPDQLSATELILRLADEEYLDQKEVYQAALDNKNLTEEQLKREHKNAVYVQSMRDKQAAKPLNLFEILFAILLPFFESQTDTGDSTHDDVVEEMKFRGHKKKLDQYQRLRKFGFALWVIALVAYFVFRRM